MIPQEISSIHLHTLKTMSEEPGRDFSGASDSITLSEGLTSASNFVQSSRPASPLSQSSNPSESQSELIKRALSVRSVLPKTSSFAERMNRARNKATYEKQDYRVIGVGSCGTIFEIPGTEFATKKGQDQSAMCKDFRFTNRVHYSIQDTREVLQAAFQETTIPRSPHCSDFWLPESNEYWQGSLPRFPRSHRTKGAAFQVDRILPIPRPVREALIKLYFDEAAEIQEEAINDVDNSDCLIRVYLGENETQAQSIGCYDSLRNFPLRLNMMKDLELDTVAFASEMAISLATIHWKARIDAMDAEFVLGSAVATHPEKRRRPYLDDSSDEDIPPSEVHPMYFNQRSIHLWVLDFDKSSRIKLTSHDVDNKLVPAFLGNDPYYPRPDVDEQLWQEFSKVYLKASNIILETLPKKDHTIMNLPERFLAKVVEKIKENEDWDPERHIVFGD